MCCLIPKKFNINSRCVDNPRSLTEDLKAECRNILHLGDIHRRIVMLTLRDECKSREVIFSSSKRFLLYVFCLHYAQCSSSTYLFAFLLSP